MPFWRRATGTKRLPVAGQGEGDLARLGQAGFAEVKNLSAEQQDLKHLGAPQEVLERMLRQQLQNIQRYHERGLAELATIGSTAPFIGLFGTVWGIMHALHDIGKSGSASLDVVSRADRRGADRHRYRHRHRAARRAGLQLFFAPPARENHGTGKFRARLHAAGTQA